MSTLPDGRALPLRWADLQGIRSFARDRALLATEVDKADSPEKRGAIMSDFTRRYMPRYACNAQRVDLILS